MLACACASLPSDPPPEQGLRDRWEFATRMAQLSEGDQAARVLEVLGPPDDVFDPREHDAPTRETSVDRFRMERTLHRTEVDVAVRLHAPATPLAEVAELVPDSVLRLGHPVSRAVEIEIEGQALWRGLVGQSGEMRAVRIVEPIEES